MIKRLTARATGLATCIVIAGAMVADACSRFAWTTDEHGVFTGRSMDWGHGFDDILIINPQGQEIDGGSSTNSLTWTSKYGSVTSRI